MKTKILIGAGLTALSLVLAKKVDLELNLKKGETYAQTMMVESEIKQTMMGQPQTINQTIEAKTYLEMIEESDDSDTYEVWYDNISLAMKTMGQNQNFSSDTASLATVDPMSKMLNALTGKKFKAKITSKGKVKEVMELEALVNEATSQMAGGAQMQEMIQGSFGNDGLTKNLETTLDIFPDKAVKPGDSWTKVQGTATGLPLIANTTFTLKSIEGNTATIEVKATLETDPDNVTTSMQGMDATLFYEGERTGTLSMDTETGWVTSGSMNDDIVGSITIAPGAQVPDGMTIPVEMKNTMTISN